MNTHTNTTRSVRGAVVAAILLSAALGFAACATPIAANPDRQADQVVSVRVPAQVPQKWHQARLDCAARVLAEHQADTFGDAMTLCGMSSRQLTADRIDPQLLECWDRSIVGQPWTADMIERRIAACDGRGG